MNIELGEISLFARWMVFKVVGNFIELCCTKKAVKDFDK